jgi:hypothetical protein
MNCQIRIFIILDHLMMCDNLSLYKSYTPPSTTMTPQFYPMNDEDDGDDDDDDDDEHRPYMSVKRKLSGIDLVLMSIFK